MGISRNHPVGRVVIAAARERGWNVTNVSEAEVAHALETLGFGPFAVETQYRLGAYRLDFAIVKDCVNIEADGWVHTAASVRARDAIRDSRLKDLGWKTVRVDTETGDIEVQLRNYLPGLAQDVLHGKPQDTGAECGTDRPCRRRLRGRPDSP